MKSLSNAEPQIGTSEELISSIELCSEASEKTANTRVKSYQVSERFYAEAVRRGASGDDVQERGKRSLCNCSNEREDERQSCSPARGFS